MTLPASIPDYVEIGSFVVAALALAVSAYNSYVSRRINEVETLFSLVEQYSRYSSALRSIDPAKPGPVAVQAFLDNANYIEVLCTIYRGGNGTKVVRENIRSLVSDHIASSNAELRAAGLSEDYIDTLNRLGSHYRSFVDTRWFSDRYSRVISDKVERILASKPGPRGPGRSGS